MKPLDRRPERGFERGLGVQGFRASWSTRIILIYLYLLALGPIDAVLVIVVVVVAAIAVVVAVAAAVAVAVAVANDSDTPKRSQNNSGHLGCRACIRLSGRRGGPLLRCGVDVGA